MQNLRKPSKVVSSQGAYWPSRTAASGAPPPEAAPPPPTPPPGPVVPPQPRQDSGVQLAQLKKEHEKLKANFVSANKRTANDNQERDLTIAKLAARCEALEGKAREYKEAVEKARRESVAKDDSIAELRRQLAAVREKVQDAVASLLFVVDAPAGVCAPLKPCLLKPYRSMH